MPYALYGLGWAKLNARTITRGRRRPSTPWWSALRRSQADGPRPLCPRHGPAAVGQVRRRRWTICGRFWRPSASPAEKAAARYVLGLCQAGLKQHAEAAATFQGLSTENPKSAIADKVLYELAWSLKQQDKEKEAAATFAQAGGAVARQPAGGRGPLPRGRVRLQVGRVQAGGGGVLWVAGEGGQLQELGEKAAHKLGWSYFRGDDFANAQQTFAYQRTTWPTGPLAADAAFMEAECLFKQKKFEAAMAAYGGVKQTGEQGFPGPGACCTRGQAAAQLKQWDKSLELLAKCVEQFPAAACLPEALYEEGWAQQNLGKLAEAVALYQQVIAKTDREVAARRSS